MKSKKQKELKSIFKQLDLLLEKIIVLSKVVHNVAEEQARQVALQ